MANTRKVLRWACDIANTSLGSPNASLNDMDATLESDVDSATGSLAYVNAQLLAHGFAYGDGLDLEGLDATNAKAVVKSILGLLSQRANDVARTEELTTKYRTLSYDHERLLSLHRAALDKTARAEQETQRFKARLAALQRDLATAESQRKAAAADLSRTRTAMQYLRTTSQQEIKRLEKDRQTFCDRFTKISDAQLNLGAVTSGMHFVGPPANAPVLDGTSFGGEIGVLEASLKSAEEARRNLMTENDELREVLLTVANRVQEAAHDATFLSKGPNAVHAELPLLTAAQLFSPPTSILSNAQNAHAKLVSLTNDLRDALIALESSVSSGSSSSQATQVAKNDEHDQEIARLQSAVDNLKHELEESEKVRATFAAQSQALFDRFATDEQFLGKVPAESSFQIPSVGDQQELQQRLSEQLEQLDEERRKFTEAAMNLGRQRAELEAQRLELLEEKRSWQVQQILSELPPTPAPAKASPLRRSIGSRTSLPASKPFPSSSSLDSLLRPQIQLQTEPVSDVPLRPASPSPEQDVITESPPEQPKRKSPKQKHVAFAVGSSPLKQRRSPPTTQHRVVASPGNHLHNTPGRPGSGGGAGIFTRKQYKHAYSPARPSPLSRIMLLGDESSAMEEDEQEDGVDPGAEEDDEHEMFPALPAAQRSPTRASFPAMPASLATELQLGVSGHSATRTRLSLPASTVSFDFAIEMDDPGASPASGPSVPSASADEPPAPSTTPDTSSDDDLRIVAGAVKGSDKENKRPRGAPLPKKAPPPQKPRVPLSPRKIKSLPGGGPKRVPVPSAAKPAPTKRISPIPTSTVPVVKRVSPVPSTAATVPKPAATASSRPASAAGRAIPAKVTGPRRVPTTGWR